MRIRCFTAGLALALAFGATGCRSSSSGGGLFANCKHRNQQHADIPVSYGGTPGICTSGPVITGPMLMNPDGTMPMNPGGGQTIPPAGIYENPAKPKPYTPEKETGRIQVKPLNEVKNTKDGN